MASELMPKQGVRMKFFEKTHTVSPRKSHTWTENPG